jgi:pyridoxal phosphate phosphatase PHOSPHO2
MFFIKTILQAHDLLQYFTEIKTNPSFVDETGRLRIQPFHPFTEGPPHGCSLCPPNMCKVFILLYSSALLTVYTLANTHLNWV